MGSWPAPEGSGVDVRRPVKTSCNKRQKIAICPQFAVAFKQRYSEALGSPTPGYRSRDATGQSSTRLRGGRADLATLWGLERVQAGYSVTSSNEVYESRCTCGGEAPHLLTYPFTTTNDGVGTQQMWEEESPRRVGPRGTDRHTGPREQR